MAKLGAWGLSDFDITQEMIEAGAFALILQGIPDQPPTLSRQCAVDVFKAMVEAMPDHIAVVYKPRDNIDISKA